MSSFDIVSGGVNARVIFSFFLSGNQKLEKSKSLMIFRCKNYDATEFTKEKACQQGKRPEATLQTTENQNVL
jgi:hypothetical protein